MSNSLAVMRMLQGLQRGGPPLMPLAGGGGGPLPELREPSPERRSRSQKKSKKKRHRSPSTSSSSSSSSSSGYSSYESVEKIKKKMKEKPCAYVSPSGLEDKKTKKDAIRYLKEKECPRVDEFKRGAPGVEPPVADAAAPSPVLSIEQPQGVKRIGRPPKPKEPKKRQPSAYALAFGEARKSGKSFAEATASAKEQIAKLKEEKNE